MHPSPQRRFEMTGPRSVPAAPPGPFEDLGVLGGVGAEEVDVRPDPDPPDVEAVSVPAHLHGGIGEDEPLGVESAGVLEQLELRRGELEVGTIELLGVRRGAHAVPWVRLFVGAAAVVEQGEQLDDERVGVDDAREASAVLAHAHPVLVAVWPLPGERELLPDRLEQLTRAKKLRGGGFHVPIVTPER